MKIIISWSPKNNCLFIDFYSYWNNFPAMKVVEFTQITVLYFLYIKISLSLFTKHEDRLK